VLKTSKLARNILSNFCTYRRVNWLASANFLKCSLYAGSFVLLTACQPEHNNTSANTTNSTVSSPQSSASLKPLLTLDELLNTADFQIGIKQSVRSNDQVSLKDWQDQLLAVAKEVHLSERDLARISGEQGLMFIEFEAKKQLFNDEFIERFMSFNSIDDLIQKYPYLTGVHQRALSLINARDSAIQRAAKLLADDNPLGADFTQEARAQWKDYMINSGRLETLQN
jgi:hypothetical protein